MKPIIQTEELINLYQVENIVLVDVSAGKDAKSNYDKKHLKGALFVDLNKQLADIQPDVSQGGRHPLPTLQQFAETLKNLGISNNSHVVLYDDNNGANAAARFWWMLKSIGHQKVQVLDGGLQWAKKAGFPVSSEIVTPNNVEYYTIKEWALPLADLEEVEAVSQNEDSLVIDVRDPDRFKGKWEPIDLIAGHIPGAINVTFSGNLDENGKFYSPEKLREKYRDLFENMPIEKIIVHCGSGVTACHTLLACDYAGLEIPKLYVGSWSEWSRNNKEIVSENF